MKFKTVPEWLKWQTQLHRQAIDLGLDRIRPVFSRLMQLSSNKPLAKQVIVVGGTNGKGSTIAFLEAIYTAAGYQVGSYTSPHLISYNERIRLLGEPVDDTQLCLAFERVESIRQEVSLTFFEFGTLAALALFQQQSLDVVLLEVGLGGRLDAVNLVDADVSVLTNIELDHMDWLGDTREKIAMEKIAISRPKKTLVYVDANLPDPARRYLQENRVSLVQFGKDFGFKCQGEVWQCNTPNRQFYGLPATALIGQHQLINAAGGLMTLALLDSELPVTMSQIRLGLTTVNLPGRFQVIAEKDNLHIFDVAHNPHSINVFLDTLQGLPRNGRRLLVFGMLRGKSVSEVIGLLKPHVDQWFLASIYDSRGLSARELEQHLIEQAIPKEQVFRFNSVFEAFESAKSSLLSYDNLLVLGSFHLVAEILNKKVTKYD